MLHPAFMALATVPNFYQHALVDHPLRDDPAVILDPQRVAGICRWQLRKQRPDSTGIDGTLVSPITNRNCNAPILDCLGQVSIRGARYKPCHLRTLPLAKMLPVGLAAQRLKMGTHNILETTDSLVLVCLSRGPRQLKRVLQNLQRYRHGYPHTVHHDAAEVCDVGDLRDRGRRRYWGRRTVRKCEAPRKQKNHCTRSKCMANTDLQLLHG